MTLDLTFHMLAMNDNCIQNSWLLIAKDFLIIFSLFLIFSHFLSLFIIFLSFLNIFYHFSGYHLYIQNPSKTNPSKSGYQDRCPDNITTVDGSELRRKTTGANKPCKEWVDKLPTSTGETAGFLNLGGPW